MTTPVNWTVDTLTAVYSDGSGTHSLTLTKTNETHYTFSMPAHPVTVSLTFTTQWIMLQNMLDVSDTIILYGNVTADAGDDTLTVQRNKTVILDLNGFTLDRHLTVPTSGGSVIEIQQGGTLTVCDSSSAKTGRITGGNNTDNGGGVRNDGTFILQSGTISGNTASAGGGVSVGFYDTRFTMQGGTISGNAADSGGAVAISGGTFTLYSGSITGNTATNGGGVYANVGTFRLYGGTITGNDASGGGGVLVDDGTLFELSYAPTVTGNTNGTAANNIELPSGMVINIVGALTNTDPIGITLSGTSRVFTKDLLKYGTAANFASDNAAYGVGVTVDGEAILGISHTITADSTISAPASAVVGSAVTVSVTAPEGYAPDKLTYTGATSGTVRYAAHSGRGFVFPMPDEDVSLSATFAMGFAALQALINTTADGETLTLGQNYTAAAEESALVINKTITIDLNGFTIDRALSSQRSQGFVFYIQNNGDLTICDSNPTAVHADTDIKGGIITGGYDANTGSGVYNLGIFTLTGGTITGNRTPGFGGAVYNSGTFSMTGGTITQNIAQHGGGVYTTSTFQLGKGTIEDNSAKENGGGVYVSSGMLIIDRGEIHGNSSANGGGVYVSTGTAVLEYGSISSNYVSNMGAGVYVYNGTFTMQNGIISDNISNYKGGGVYVYGLSTFNMQGGAVTGNTAYEGAGVFVAVSLSNGVSRFGTFNISGGPKVIGNECMQNGNPMDVCLQSMSAGSRITVTGALTSEAQIALWFSSYTSGTFTTGFHDNAGTEVWKVFQPDDNGYIVGIDADGEALYGKKHSVTGVNESTAYGTLSIDRHTGDSEFAPKGGVVTVTVTPAAAGCGLTSLTYQKINSTAQSITPTNGVYTFTMPDTIVTITAVFDMTWATLQAYLDDIGSGNAGSIQLLKDVTAGVDDEFLRIGSGTDVILDLNGHILDRNCSQPTTRGSCICVSGKLTVRDSNPTAEHAGTTIKGGIITGGNAGQSGSEQEGGGILVAENAECILESGTIAGNTALYGGGVYVNANEAKFTMTGGTVTGNTATECGGGVYVHTAGMFTLNGGTISDNTAVQSGGGIYAYGSFRFLSGAVTENTAGSGGGAYFTSINNSTFTMTGGTISHNTASYRVGGVLLENGTFTMTGGTITQNSAPNTTGGVYVCEHCYLAISDSPVVSGNTLTSGQESTPADVLLAAGTLIIVNEALTTSSSIGVSLENVSGVFTDGFPDYANPPATQVFFANKSGFIPGENADGEAMLGAERTITLCNNTAVFGTMAIGTQTAGTLTLPEGSTGTVTVTPTAGCALETLTAECADGTAFTLTKADNTHYTFTVLNQNVTVTAVFDMTWASLKAALNKGGTVTLLKDVTAPSSNSGYLTVSASGGTVLDLNGHILNRNLTERTQDGYVICVDGPLTLVDSNPDAEHTGTEIKGGIITGGCCDRAGGVYVQYSTFTMQGGTITGNSSKNGSGVYVQYSTFTMQGGTITGNFSDDTSSYGGGVCLNQNTTFTMSGGSITGNRAARGGGLYISDGCTFVMTGGSISNNSTGTRYGGGGIYLNGSNALFRMEGGEITDNTANQSGGGVYVSSQAQFTMSGGTISRNTATSGGGVYCAYFTMTGGTISYNTTEGSGGGVYCNVSFEMTAGTISYNTAEGDGGGVYLTGNNREYTMKGGTISNNTATDNGGGVFVSSSCSFNMTGGSITGNKASTRYGGGIYSKGTLSVSNGTISNNTAKDNGGGVYMYSDSGLFTLSDSVISGNTTEGSGGGVFIYSGSFTLSDSVISGNTTEGSGGGVYFRSGVFNMDGGAISQNTSEQGFGGGVFIYSGSFTLKSGSINGNRATSGGGIYVSTSAQFTMTGGTIAENTSDANGGGVYNCGTFDFKNGTIAENKAARFGGGVFTGYSGTFNMTGGAITDNQVNSTEKDVRGGGVYYNSGVFNMDGGAITDNQANSSLNAYGGGVYVSHSFCMNGGTITGNRAIGGGNARGGGLCVDSGVSVTMRNASITGNTAESGSNGYSYGGGVYNSGTFVMESGTISGNTAESGSSGYSYGGGVYNSGTFVMESGTISGNTAESGSSSSSYGGGVYIETNYTFTMLNGTITGNYAQYIGGGVYNCSTFEISGSPLVTGNTCGGSSAAPNVFLYNQKKISVVGTLTADARLCVSRSESDADTDLTTGLSGKGTAANFTSDNPAYAIGIHENGEAYLITGFAITVVSDYGTVNAPVSAAGGETVTLSVTPRDGFALSALSVTKDSNGEALSLNNNTFTMPAEPVTVTATYTGIPEPAITSHAMLLSGEIGVKFKVTYPDGYDMSGATLDFTIGGVNVGTVTFDQADYANANARFFTCNVNALQLNDTITATLHVGGLTVTDQFSAMQYIEAMKNSTDPSLVKLVKALQDYGYYLQQSGWTDGGTHTAIEKIETLDDSAIPDVLSDTEHLVAIEKTPGSGIENILFSLTLNAETKINVFVKPKDGVTILSEGYTLTSIGGETYYRFTTAPIGPLNLGKTQTFTIQTSAGQATVKASAMSYVKSILEYNDASVISPEKKLAMVAYYNYFTAALAYKAAHPGA